MKPCIENNPPPCADPPKIIKWADPDFSKEARKQHYSGKVVLWAVVGTDGKVHEIKVQQSIGLGLDEQAIKAVKKWRFKPGTFEGKPVPVQINAEVDFRYKD